MTVRDHVCPQTPAVVAERVVRAHARQTEPVLVLPVELDAVRLLGQVLAAQVHDDLVIDAFIQRCVMTRAPRRDLERQVQR